MLHPGQSGALDADRLGQFTRRLCRAELILRPVDREIRRAHRLHVDRADQRFERADEPLVVGVLGRDQHQRVVGGEGALGVFENDQPVGGDPPVGGIGADDIRPARSQGVIHERRVKVRCSRKRSP